MESTHQTQLITISPKAAEKVMEFMKQENKDSLYLRVYVSGGGCSGLSYGMGFEEKPDEDDSLIDQNGIKMIVDSYSQKYLKGTNIDYIESLMGSGFKINNPNVTKSCSCGHSFSTE
jgi:iron-sulfur cluster assembly protein